MKKQIISTGVVMAATFFLMNPGVLAASKSSKPMNVLFLVCDDMNSLMLGNTNRYGGKVVAPNIKGLADRGVNFTQNFTAAPLCSPSRTAFLFGVAPWKSGVYGNGYNIKTSPALKNIPSLPMLFRKNGYYTAGSGKIFHGYEDDCWDESIGHSRDPHPAGAPMNGYATNRAGKVVENDWGPTDLPESRMNDTKVADFAIAQLKKKHDKPFFIACGTFHPHMPAYAPQKYFDLYPLDSIQCPPTIPNDLADVPEIGRNWANSNAFSGIFAHHQWKNAIQGYLASTSYADAQMGRVLDTVDNSPYKDNTIVVLMSDNGFHIGEKEHWQKATLWEEATHVLLMFRVPGLTKPHQVCTRTVSLLDVYPTLVDLTHLPHPPQHLDGQSLVPLLKNPDAPWSHPAFSALLSSMAVRTDAFRFIRYSDATTELYDCTKDPHEWKNLTKNPEYAARKKQLDAKLPAQSAMAPSVPRKARGSDKSKSKKRKKKTKS